MDKNKDEDPSSFELSALMKKVEQYGFYLGISLFIMKWKWAQLKILIKQWCRKK